MEGFRNAVVVSCLLGGKAFVGRVAGVGKPRPLLKLVHAILSLLWEEEEIILRIVEIYLLNITNT